MAARRVAVQSEKNRAEKAQREFIMNRMKQEQERGAFNNTPNGPVLDGPMLNGPVLDGPISFDGDLLNVNDSVIDAISEEIKSEEKEELLLKK